MKRLLLVDALWGVGRQQNADHPPVGVMADPYSRHTGTFATLYFLSKLVVWASVFGLEEVANRVFPHHFLSKPRPSGTAAGVLLNLDATLSMHYQLRGWDAQGKPTRERLEALGLEGNLE
ncbi:MAG: aldehyde ferredoxin oxidoreductase C-terminal domain-containing protein [Chloroflexota bacterium]|nr:aldehyde ferredoxin oxidoreductase C-terminal domain-containing protein [Chloroflexota bacterium]